MNRSIAIRPLTLGALIILTTGSAIFAMQRSLAGPADGNKGIAKGTKPAVKLSDKSSDDARIVHVLNRLGYGPRPGEVERVKSLGLMRYIEEQLTPEQINDGALDAKLASFTQLTLTGDQIGAQYHELMQSTRQSQALRRKMKKASGTTAQDLNWALRGEENS